ncbi:MAG: hypothetical protein GWN71_20860, partial [Gammaproteobacteria bacterium]|nr:hypothetical protein [Gemmatimonadota bacterium]NIU75924.1 hypothetical protein [Gammaproteobacteria bacterium]
IIVVADGDAGSTLLVLEPPQPEALGRRSVGGVRDLAVTSWGDRIYVLEDDPGADPAIHALG